MTTVVIREISLDNKKALKAFWGLVQIQDKTAFLGGFRVPNKDYCLINPEISLDNLTLKIIHYLNYGTRYYFVPAQTNYMKILKPQNIFISMSAVLYSDVMPTRCSHVPRIRKHKTDVPCALERFEYRSLLAHPKLRYPVAHRDF